MIPALFLRHIVNLVIDSLKSTNKLNLKVCACLHGLERDKERDYIKILRGRLRAMKLSANALIDLIEQRSSSKTSTREVSASVRIILFASLAAFKFLAAMTTWTPRRANTLEVSNPIPLAPPAFTQKEKPLQSLKLSLFWFDELSV